MNFFKTGSHALKVRLMSLFIGLSLAVTWFYNVKPWAIGVPGNATNLMTFGAMSKTMYHMETLGVWRARIGGLWIAGQMFDGVVKTGPINIEDYKAQKIQILKVTRQDNASVDGVYFYVDDYQRIFGLYQATWLFLFFVMLILFLENPLLIIFGTFGGLLYTLTPAAVYYSYPWDIPSMTFFMLGYLLWRRKLYNWMLAAIFVGCVFKETTAVIAILFFFTDLPMKKRVIYFIGAGVMAFFQKMAIMEVLYHIATIHTQDFTLWQNVKEFFSMKWNHFIFVNAGTLMVAVLLPGRTRWQWGTKALILVFWGCQAWAGSFNEFRIMLEVLPVSLLCIWDYMTGTAIPQTATASALQKPAKSAERPRR